MESIRIITIARDGAPRLGQLIPVLILRFRGLLRANSKRFHGAIPQQLLTPFTKGKRLQLVEAPRSIEIFRPWGSFVLSIFAPHGTRPFCALGHRAHWPMTSRSVHDKQL